MSPLNPSPERDPFEGSRFRVLDGLAPFGVGATVFLVVLVVALARLWPLLVTCPPHSDRIVIWHGARPAVACVPR